MVACRGRIDEVGNAIVDRLQVLLLLSSDE